MIVLKINKQFGSSKNKVSIDISSSEALRFIEYLEAHAIFCTKPSSGEKAKYASYIELISLNLMTARHRTSRIQARAVERSMQMMAEINSVLKVPLDVIAQGL